MQLGIFAKIFSGPSPHAVLQAVRNAGFTAAQYNMACSGLPAMPDAILDDVITEIIAAATAADVKLIALSGTYNMVHPDVAIRSDGHKQLAVIVKAAQALAIPLVTLCTGTRDANDQWKFHPDNDSVEAWRDLLTSMQIAVEIADQFDVHLGIEPELANVVNSAESARRLVDEIASPRLKIILDPANLFEVETLERQRHIIAHAIDLLADRIIMGHAKDRASTGDFTAAGKGVLDFPHYIKCLKSAGFDGPLITHGLAASEAADVYRFLSNEVGR
jgi:sugar phosphate isomerase/epimerase